MKWISSLLRTAIGFATFGIALAVGCHSAKIKNPTITGTSLATNTNWLQEYKKAKSLKASDPTQACHLFTGLAQEQKFPARELASLRRLEVCEEAQSVALDRAALPVYLQDLALDVALSQVAKNGDRVAEMELAYDKSKQNLLQGEKIKWMQVALERAEELGQEARQEEFRKRLYTIAPRLNPEPKVREFLEVATDLRMARQFAKAREYYEKVLTSAHFNIEQKISALKGIRLGYKNARQMDDHIESAKRLVEYLKRARKSNPRSQFLRQAYYDAEVFYGRAIWTDHRRSEALDVFDKLEKRMKGKVSLAELYWLKARLAEEEANFDNVSHYLELALRQKIREPEMRDKIYWYGAWNERRRNNLPRAAELLVELEEKTRAEFTRVRSLFWLGKTYHELRRDEESKAAFEKLISLDPVGYYGLLAHRNLDQQISFKLNSTAKVDDPKLPLDRPMAEWLHLLEEREVLTSLLDHASRAYKKQPDQTDDGWIALFQYYAKAGLYTKLYEAMGGLTPERRRSVLERHPDLLFPQPWTTEVRTAALQFGVDEELIYAIMRQESAFDNRARSFADAFGLMQVLPEVAEIIGNRNKIAYSGMDDLYDPKTNVMIGAAHIKDLLDRHKGQFILAVASYNANENAIKNWMKTRFRGDSLEFIEEIPYEETRTYVRLVMRNLIFYSLLKSKNASIEFPSWVLKLEDAS
jgi:soluble lytic murein transglycosylase